ncbi:MAG: peptidylprolyl isomerase [bacterium]|nr:peptidylprolyl isomerase [bacterium]
MRFMEAIRRRGHWFLIGFLVIFTISLFFGLTGGFEVNPFANDGQGQKVGVARGTPSVVSDKDHKDTAMVVDGRTVSSDVLEQVVALFIQNYGMDDESDPTVRLNAYGYAAGMVANQEVMMAYGQEKGIRMAAEDWATAKAEASAGFVESTDEKKSGNILGDTLGKLGDIKAQNAAFDKYLEVNGYSSEESWERDAQRDLYTRKVREAIEEEVNADKKAEVEKTKIEVDKELAAKKDFAEVAKKYSDGQSKEKGGDLDWLGRGLLEKEVSEKLFALKKGETSDWIEIPAGIQKFLVYDKQEASGAAFEKDKAGLTQTIRDERKDQKYEPTADDYKEKYEKVRARVVELHTTDAQKSGERIEKMMEAADIQVNHPYVLAYQALRDFQIQPVDALTREQLITIARLTPIGEDYDFSVLDAKLEAGKPKGTKAATADAKTTDENAIADPAADSEIEAVEGAPDISGAASMTDSAGTEAARDSVEEEEKVTTPIYALAAGLVEKAIQDSDGGTGDDWPFFLQAKIYADWMQDEAEAEKQPLKTKEARARMEDLLAKVVKSSNYNATAHALRGLNLARLDKAKEAGEELTIAEKYARSDAPAVWQTIREGYEVLDDTAKLAEVDKKLQEIQQKQFQEMIQKQLSQQGGGEGMPIQVR